jgi:hypothetical protein
VGVKFMEEDGGCQSLDEEGLASCVVGDDQDATCIDVAEDVPQSLLEHDVGILIVDITYQTISISEGNLNIQAFFRFLEPKRCMFFVYFP